VLSELELVAGVGLAKKAGAAIQAVKAAVRTVGKIWKAFDDAKTHVSIENQELSFRVPERTGQYSVALKLKTGPLGHSPLIQFPIPGVTKVVVHALDRAFSPQPQSVIKVPSGYAFDASKLASGIQSILVTFDFVSEEPGLMDALVERSWTHDSAEDKLPDVSEYWMTAQLRHPSVLRTDYGRLDLRGFDVRVDVGVSQDVKTAIGNPFSRHLEVVNRLMLTRDRNESVRLALQKAKGVRFAGRENELIAQVQDLFYERAFRKFVEVIDPFHYDNCYRGADMYEIPMLAIPKAMTIIARTDLSLEHPASDGKMLYKKRELRDTISKALGVSESAS